MTNFKGNYFKYIFFILLLIFASTTNTALALEQLRNYDFNGNINNWQNKNPVSNANTKYDNIDYNSNDLRFYSNRNGNTRNYDGVVFQDFTTPAAPVNANFRWSYNISNANSGNGWNRNVTETLRFLYQAPTVSNTAAGIALGDDITTTNGSGTGEKLIQNLNANTTYRAKIYSYSSLQYKNITVRIQYFCCNISPSGLTATPSTTNTRTVNIAGTNYRISTAINLNWNRSTSNAVTFTNYKIYRSNAENGTYTLLATINNQNTTTYADTAPLAGENWYYITDTGSDGVESPASMKAYFGSVTGYF